MKKVAIVRGKFLNRYEMQFFEPLTKRYDMTAFGSLTPYHDQFTFPVIKLPSPMDVPDFPYKMPILNRLFTDAHYLYGLEDRLRGFDLVHTAETYFRYTQQCLEAKKRGYVRKVIATVLENIPFNNEGLWGRKAYKQRARQELDHMIALTQQTREAMLAEGADPNKITVISHYIDARRFAPDRKHFARLADPKRRSLTILFTGRLETYKGVMDVLDAATDLTHDPQLNGFTLNFLFVGDGSQKRMMMEKERQIGKNWHFRHESATYDEMPKYYRQVDIFVAPSKPTPTWEEQYCTVLLEAQAAGLPIVTTHTGGIPENVGNAAVVVPPGDTRAIAAALKQFILFSDKRKTFAQSARKRALTVHDKAIGAAKLADLYERVLNS